MRSFFYSLLIATATAAQPVSIGIRGGVPLQKAFSISTFGQRQDFLAPGPLSGYAGGQVRTRPYTVGPALEIAGPRQLRFGVDVLYRRLGFTETRIIPSVSSTSIFLDQKVTANRWDAAFTVKRAFGRPFVSGGLAYNRVTGARYEGLAGTRSAFGPGVSLVRTSGSATPERRQGFGLVAGGGVEWRAGRLRIAPEVRYWAWPSRNFDTGAIRSSRNQFDFLLGLLL